MIKLLLEYGYSIVVDGGWVAIATASDGSHYGHNANIVRQSRHGPWRFSSTTSTTAMTMCVRTVIKRVASAMAMLVALWHRPDEWMLLFSLLFFLHFSFLLLFCTTFSTAVNIVWIRFVVSVYRYYSIEERKKKDFRRCNMMAVASANAFITS